MAHLSPALARLLQRARRRQCVQLIFEQMGIAFGVAMLGLVLLLVLGTQVLDWYWIFLLAAGAGVVGAWRVRTRTVTLYRIGQILDSRLQLHDAISTAYFFEKYRKDVSESGIVAIQRAQAERAAARANVALAFPYVVPKALYGAFGIALVAFGMFAVRYGVTRKLDLRPSLVKIAFDTFVNPQPQRAEKKVPIKKPHEDQLQKLGMNTTPPEVDQIDPTENSLLSAANSNANNTRTESDSEKSKAGAAESKRQADSSNDEQESKGDSDKGSETAGPDQQAQGENPSAEKPQSNTPDSQNAASNNTNGNNSLMDKMRDAMANLMNKLKMQSHGESGQQTAQKSQDGRSQQAKADKSGQTAGRQRSDAAGSPGEQGDPQQAQGSRAQSAQAKNGQQAGQNTPSKDPKSGVGSEEGDKSNKLAEQLDAMGKISEILGKRAQDMSGEVMVEVSSGSQQLRTQYSGGTAMHSDAGGEISRDEVPLMYRQYVQHYFEQIRHAAPNGAHSVKTKPHAVDLSAAPSHKKTKLGEE